MSQPALSRQMRDLEELSGAQLLVRATHGIELTAAGEIFLDKARRVLANFDALTASVRQLDQDNPLKIGFFDAMLTGRAGEVLRRFAQDHLQTVELTPGEQLKALRTGQIDIGLIGLAGRELLTEFDLYILEPMPVCAVIPAAHELAGSSTITLDQLRQERFLTPNRDAFPGRTEHIEEACQRAGFQALISCGASELGSLLTQVGQGKGVTLLCGHASYLPHPNSVFIPLVDSLEMSICAAVRAGECRPMVLEFLAGFEKLEETRIPELARMI